MMNRKRTNLDRETANMMRAQSTYLAAHIPFWLMPLLDHCSNYYCRCCKPTSGLTLARSLSKTVISGTLFANNILACSHPFCCRDVFAWHRTAIEFASYYYRWNEGVKIVVESQLHVLSINVQELLITQAIAPSVSSQITIRREPHEHCIMEMAQTRNANKKVRSNEHTHILAVASNCNRFND